MSNATPSRLGKSHLAGDADALFLKMFSGEILTTFETKNVALDKHIIRTIPSGKSAQFPVMGRAVADYHTPGQEITGSDVEHAEVTISINDLLLTSTFIANIDEAKNHYEVRSVYSKTMGTALSNQFDRHVLNTLTQAALTTTSNLSTEADKTGEIITDADADTNADSLIQSIFDAAAALDEKDVGAEGCYVFLKPTQYYMLVNSSSKLINVDFSPGNGSVASGKVMEVAGMKIIKTNQLPQTNVTSGVEAGTSSRQAVDARNVVALISHESAAGTVKLMDLAVESEYDIRRQGTLMVAKYAFGHGVLRPEAAAVIRTATPSDTDDDDDGS